MDHWFSDAERIACRMEPWLSWKNMCRSLSERTTAARDVSLRMYCVALVLLGLNLVAGFGGAVGLGAGGLLKLVKGIPILLGAPA